MINSLLSTKSGTTRTNLTLDDIRTVLQDSDTLLWLDLSGEDIEQFEIMMKH